MTKINQETVYTLRNEECHAYSKGSEAETTIALIAGNHGDETGPQEIAEKILKNHDKDEIKITVIPKANIFASKAKERTTPLDNQKLRSENRDLNRVYETARKELEKKDPDTAKLNLTEEIGYHVLDFIVNGVDPDLVIDMHTATSGSRKMPQIRYKLSESYVLSDDIDEIAQYAEVNVIASPVSNEAEMMAAVLPKYGLPCLTVELGGGTEFQSQNSFTNEDAENYENIVNNVMNYYLNENLTGNSPVFNSIEKRYLDLDIEGNLTYNKDLGEEIRIGETVAYIETKNDKYDIKAHTNGVLETILTKDMCEEVKHKDRIFNIAK